MTSPTRSGCWRSCTDGSRYTFRRFADRMTDLAAFEERISYPFRDREILVRALTHKSYSHEAKNGSPRDNETFEFLGDSVLGLFSGALLSGVFPGLEEGPF